MSKRALAAIVSAVVLVVAGVGLALRPPAPPLSAWAFGVNVAGALGDGTTDTRGAPVLVGDGLGDITALAASSHSLACNRDGDAFGWGANRDGQLADAARAEHPEPRVLEGLGGPVADVAAGLGFSVFALRDGTVRACGVNRFGQCGRAPGAASAKPKDVARLDGVVAVEAGDYFALAVKNDGTVWAWGRNDHGQLGDGATRDRGAAAPVRGLPPVRAVAAGSAHAVAIGRDGSVWAWGWNSTGQLGDGTRVDRTKPVRIDLHGAVAAAAGASHSAALLENGAVWTWGWNRKGQLGNGTQAARARPQRVDDLAHVTAIAATTANTYALTLDGAVWAWGDGGFGHLGDGETGPAGPCTTPARVPGVNDAKALAASDTHVLLVRR